MRGKNGVFANCDSPAKRPGHGADQNLTNAELGKVQDLQGETVSITERWSARCLPRNEKP